MIPCKKWDIILVPFPFTNLTTSKKRPALIISPDEYNLKSDIVIAFITSNLNSPPRFGDYTIQDWESAGLPKPSMLRMKFATIDKSMIIRQLGTLHTNDQLQFKNKLIDFFSNP